MPQPAQPALGLSALASLLTMSMAQIRAQATPELLELASDEAFSISLQLAGMASDLRALRSWAGGDESSTASADASRPCARRTSPELVR